MATITFAVAVVWAVVMSTRYVFVSSEGCVNTTTGVKSFKLEITPTTRTPVTGGAVTFKCSIEFETASAQRLKTRLHHLWLYAPHLSTRMAGFHPQKPPNPQDPDVSQSPFGGLIAAFFYPNYRYGTKAQCAVTMESTTAGSSYLTRTNLAKASRAHR
ncbi:hypothetical protein BaRGS_00028445 [Batillaria attramentaria]|uniref:Secreted protein n=1 Tax=Batillaria attramentaria TaxID=370345 RepID=A0ABD0JYY3_9CAEN